MMEACKTMDDLPLSVQLSLFKFRNAEFVQAMEEVDPVELVVTAKGDYGHDWKKFTNALQVRWSEI